MTGPAGPQGPAGPAGTGSIFEENFAFAGFTPVSYTGNVGGRINAHATCGAAFPGAHLCHVAEYLRVESTVTIPAGGAWIDLSSDLNGTATSTASTPVFGRNTGGACANWTSAASGNNGYALMPDGGVASAICSTSHPLACCNGAPKVVFAGVTSANATMGGRVQMYALCGANYVGSHMCHVSEYLRADSSAPIPAGGAWIDLSSDINGVATSTSSSPLFGRNTAGVCANWTSAASGNIGYVVLPEGGISSANCNTTHPVACCM